MRRDTSRANRAIALGDKSEWQLNQEQRTKLERVERVFLKPSADVTRVYTASRCVREPLSIIWASVISRTSGIYLLPTVRESVSKITGRGLLSAVATLGGLRDSHGTIFYYCDDPELPNPLETTSPPA